MMARYLRPSRKRHVIIAMVGFCAVACGNNSDSGGGNDSFGSEIPAPYDLAILNGEIIDGTGQRSFEGDILVNGDTIVFVGDADEQSLKAAKVIDAVGRKVTPGFIDIHSHGDPLVHGSFWSFLAQGVTTTVLGQDGRTPGFYLTDPLSIATWMDQVSARGADTNIAPLMGHGTLRYEAGVGKELLPSEEQKQEMARQLQSGLRSGSFGLSLGLEYVPGVFASTEELLDLAKIVGSIGGVVICHLRSEDDDKIETAIDELVQLGAFAPVHVSHIKIVFARHAGQAKNVLSQIDTAKKNGVKITADVYPYLAGFADFKLVYPSWARTRPEFEESMNNNRAELEQYVHDRVHKRNGPQSILIMTGQYASQTLAQAENESGQPFTRLILDEFGFGGPLAAHFIMIKEVQEQFILDDSVAIATDGGPSVKHPRSYGTYPKFIQDFVLSNRVDLVTAVRKMSGIPAEILGLGDRGKIAEGAKADILVFDPENIRSRATWSQHDLTPLGFDYIIVNGQIAAQNGKQADRVYGRLLRQQY